MNQYELTRRTFIASQRMKNHNPACLKHMPFEKAHRSRRSLSERCISNCLNASQLLNHSDMPHVLQARRLSRISGVQGPFQSRQCPYLSCRRDLNFQRTHWHLCRPARVGPRILPRGSTVDPSGMFSAEGVSYIQAEKEMHSSVWVHSAFMQGKKTYG